MLNTFLSLGQDFTAATSRYPLPMRFMNTILQQIQWNTSNNPEDARLSSVDGRFSRQLDEDDLRQRLFPSIGDFRGFLLTMEIPKEGDIDRWVEKGTIREVLSIVHETYKPYEGEGEWSFKGLRKVDEQRWQAILEAKDMSDTSSEQSSVCLGMKTPSSNGRKRSRKGAVSSSVVPPRTTRERSRRKAGT